MPVQTAAVRLCFNFVSFPRLPCSTHKSTFRLTSKFSYLSLLLLLRRAAALWPNSYSTSRSFLLLLRPGPSSPMGSRRERPSAPQTGRTVQAVSVLLPRSYTCDVRSGWRWGGETGDLSEKHKVVNSLLFFCTK